MIFLTKSDIIKFHERTIIEHGGSFGIRDEGLLESAILAAENRVYYEEAGIIVCAATYAFHLIQSHAFIDGNKRIGAIVAEIFLESNSAMLTPDNEVMQEVYMKVAIGEMSREELEKFFFEHVEFL
jgi:death on curing protein